MITETIKDGGCGLRAEGPQRLLKIIKETRTHLLLTDGQRHLMFKTYTISGAADLELVRVRSSFSHEGLISISKIEVASGEEFCLRGMRSCGILFEKY
jgi:hypothetical protein